MTAVRVRRLVSLAILWTVASPVNQVLHGQAADRAGMTGQALYVASCAACHAPDGKGQPRDIVGFETPLPDFTDCRFTTPEADLDWQSVVHMGGTIRALSQRMPSFIDALSEDEVDRIIAYIREFCAEPGWPRGDLNFPRPFFTEKAYPENEAVLTTTMARRPQGSLGNDFLYEHRIGRRAQYEINVPFEFQHGDNGSWRRGLGDINTALKYALYDSLDRGSIFGAGGEITFPTGKETEGLGGGVTIFEGFALFGQALPRDGFLQGHVGFELPANRDRANNEIYWRTAIGKTYTEHRWGRAWSPMVEVLGAREFERGGRAEWDLVPQLQVSLSGLQHVLLNAGVRLPVNERESRNNAVMVYLLWDWFDGGLFSNWRGR